MDEAKRTCDEFRKSDSSDVSYFGTGAKTMVQWLTRLSKDFTERLAVAATEDEFHELEYWDKALKIVLNVTKSVRQNGVDSSDLNLTVKEQCHWATLPPVVPNNIPYFILAGQYKYQVRQATLGKDFWQQLLSDRTVAFADKVELIADRLVEMQDHEATFQQSMLAMFSAETLEVVTNAGDTRIFEAVEPIRIGFVLSTATLSEITKAYSPGDLERGCGLLEKEDGAFSSTLSLRKVGREFVKAAKTKLDLLEGSTSKLRTVKDTSVQVVDKVRAAGSPNTVADATACSEVAAACSKLQDCTLSLRSEDVERQDTVATECCDAVEEALDVGIGFALTQAYARLDQLTAAAPWPEEEMRTLVSIVEITTATLKQGVVLKTCGKNREELTESADQACVQVKKLLASMPTICEVHTDPAK